MESREQYVLAAQLHAALVDHIRSVSRTVFLITGCPVDVVMLVRRLERDLNTEIARIGTEPSCYDETELGTRRGIAAHVVRTIRREVEQRG